LPLLHLAILAVIQGLTEFLPVSSSGHLALVPHLMDWPDQGILIDIAVHVGTLGAVMVYCWRDIGRMLAGIFRLFQGRREPGLRLVTLIIVGSLPVVIAGFLVSHYLSFSFRSLEVIAWATIGFGLLLGFFDRIGMTIRRIEHMTHGAALFVGCAQALALIPGASRSGVTMTAARFLGFERADAARFSLLLGIPAILGAGTLGGVELYRSADVSLGLDAALAAGIAFVAALISITAMMAWLRRAGFMPFVVYRILLGGALLAWIYL
jgi:undecaprenyl-diphosphatase